MRSKINDPYNQMDVVDFGGAFFTLAAKFGSSGVPHIDFNDHVFSLTWLVCFGDWEGANFSCPQLGIRIPISSGQAFACMTRLLAHCGDAVVRGRRLVLTLFSDHTMIKASERTSTREF